MYDKNIIIYRDMTMTSVWDEVIKLAQKHKKNWTNTITIQQLIKDMCLKRYILYNLV